MRVLITNNRLDLRGGAEMFVRDLARGLQARGHSGLAYSSDLGQGERLLESDPVAVTTDLENLVFRPDIIHAQHHLDAMTALGALQGVPALYHCHGASLVRGKRFDFLARAESCRSVSTLLLMRLAVSGDLEIAASFDSTAIDGTSLRP